MIWTRRMCCVLFCFMGYLGMVTYRMRRMKSRDLFDPPPFRIYVNPFTTPHTTAGDELMEVAELLEWPEPPTAVSNISLSTSPQKSSFHLLDTRTKFKVGETLRVLITAKDHNGYPKTYGGDFFQSKLHSLKFKAGVTGSVEDFGNGSYLATFLLPWPGEVAVKINLIQSSEAVAVLKDKRERYPGKVYFHGLFRRNGITEVTECNIELERGDVCTYTHPISGDTWQCVRPQKLPCDSWVYLSTGGFRNVTSLVEGYLLSGSVTDQNIKGSVRPLIVEETSSITELISKLPVCKPGQELPQPSGYYYNDDWVSLTCRGQHFPHPSNASTCLRGKNIYMFGDSTLRQWFEYLERFIPSLKSINLHGNNLPGPLLAIDHEFGLLLSYRAHGLPLRTTQTMVSDLHYESVEIAGISGGPHTVVVLTLWAHFTSFPIRFYIRRLAQVRKAVVSLLARSPQTTVIMKTANTGSPSVYTSDWLALQLDILMRAAFKGLNVAMIDAWDMTSCHYSMKNIHPGQHVIRNEVDLMLSYICPH